MGNENKSDTVTMDRDLALDLLRAEVQRLRANGSATNGHATSVANQRIIKAAAELKEIMRETKGARVWGIATVREKLARIANALEVSL